MPIAVTTIALPADLAELKAGDADGDGAPELVAVARKPGKDAPDPVTLTVLELSAAGAEAGRWTADLGTRAMLWDIDKGLWGVDGEGLVAIVPGGPRRVTTAPSVLAALGPTSPRAADIAEDLDGDGIPEVLVCGAGRCRAIGTDGKDRGSVPIKSEGRLSNEGRAGGRGLVASVVLPPLARADLDADGKVDLLLPRGTRLSAWRTAPGVGAGSAAIPLPFDVDPREDPRRRTGARTELDQVWFRDIDGDRRADLVARRWVLDGSWFGSKGEFVVHKGSGAGFGGPVSLRTPSAPVVVELLDHDGDGDTDLLLGLVDVGLGNLGRALVSRKVELSLVLHPWTGASWAPTGVPLRKVEVPVERPESLSVSMDGDLDGDGLRDLVIVESDGVLRVFAGTRTGVSPTPLATQPVVLPPGEDPLLVADVCGDSRAEIVVWGPGQTEAKVLRLTR